MVVVELGRLAPPLLEIVLARRFEEVIVARLSEGGRGGRDLSLSTLLLRPTVVDEVRAAPAKSDDEGSWSSCGVRGKGMLNVEAVERVSSLFGLVFLLPLPREGGRMMERGVRVAMVVSSSGPSPRTTPCWPSSPSPSACSGILSSNENPEPALLVLVRPPPLPLAAAAACPRFCQDVGGMEE